jgi:hypothetical protein
MVRLKRIHWGLWHVLAGGRSAGAVWRGSDRGKPWCWRLWGHSWLAPSYERLWLMAVARLVLADRRERRAGR